MALALTPSEGFTVTVASTGTAVELSPQIRENTHTVLAYNPSQNAAYLRWQTSDAQITSANGTVIPPGGAVTLAFGSASQRPVSGALGLWLDAAADDTSVHFTYVNGVTG